MAVTKSTILAAKKVIAMGEVVNFLKDLFPTQVQVAVGGIASFIGSSFAHIVGWNALVEALIVTMAIDWFTGMLAAYKYKKKHPNTTKGGWNSKVGFLGIIRKVSILAVVCFAHYLDYATGISAIHTIVVWFYIGNEGLSIVENAAKAGAPVPDSLKNKLDQLAHEKKERSDTNACESKH